VKAKSLNKTYFLKKNKIIGHFILKMDSKTNKILIVCSEFNLYYFANAFNGGVGGLITSTSKLYLTTHPSQPQKVSARLRATMTRSRALTF
jgi:hypothetical protein